MIPPGGFRPRKLLQSRAFGRRGRHPRTERSRPFRRGRRRAPAGCWNRRRRFWYVQISQEVVVVVLGWRATSLLFPASRVGSRRTLFRRMALRRRSLRRRKSGFFVVVVFAVYEQRSSFLAVPT